MTRHAHFREVQRFRQRWLWALLGGTLLFALAFGPAGFLGGGIVLAVATLLYLARLTTEVREDGVYVKFFPFHLSFRRFAWDEIERYEATTYSPLGEFGGWGIRWRPGRIAYNVGGDEGVRIYRPNGRTVLIGSRRPDELAAAIDAASAARA
jgi:hypothetical protein